MLAFRLYFIVGKGKKWRISLRTLERISLGATGVRSHYINIIILFFLIDTD